MSTGVKVKETGGVSLGPSSALYQLFWGEGSPTKVDYTKKLVLFNGLRPGSAAPIT